MRTFEFRVLVIDDDAAMVNKLAAEIGGLRVELGSRSLLPRIDRLLVEVVVDADGSRRFSETTIHTLIALSSVKYDYVILDYSYAPKDKQLDQWNESKGRIFKKGSNAHLLTISDLRLQAEDFSIRLGREQRERVAAFFDHPQQVMLRSFQHDRTHDILGSFEQRESVTRMLFPGLKRLDRLNSFGMIYGSDAGLREELYHASRRGRELYRNIATQLTGRFVETAMISSLAEKASKALLPRTAASVSILVVMVSALASFVQALVTPAIELAASQDWGLFATLSTLSILALAGGSLGIAMIAEFGLNRLFGGKSEHDRG